MVDEFTLLEQDVPFEEDVVTHPYSVKAWLRYLKHKRSGTDSVRDALYERALAQIPGSYKIWRRYLRERTQRVRRALVTDPEWDAVGNVFERALVFMHAMPRIWLEYLEFLFGWHAVSRVRRVLDRALAALPITQHERVWAPVLDYISGLEVPVPATGIALWRRYLKLGPHKRHDYVEYLMGVDEVDEAAKELVVLLDEAAVHPDATGGATRHELWLTLCSLISGHATRIVSIPVEAILRTGVTQFSDQVGTLWTSLANYFIRLAQFDRARDVFEEGMLAVTTVSDFTLVFDAYIEFEDSLLAAKLQILEEAKAAGSAGNKDIVELDADLQLRFERYQHLIDRRPFLINSVLLRQNPSNVFEWLKRVELYKAAQDGVNVVATFSRGLDAVDPSVALGPLHQLWIDFAVFYEEAAGDVDAARAIFERAVTAEPASLDSLVAIWLAYSELEVRAGQVHQAKSLLQRAVTVPAKFRSSNRTVAPASVSYYDTSIAAADRLFKSTKLWSAYVDLVEALSPLDATKAVYEEILDLRVATPALVLNYASMLIDAEYFEEAFAVFERGVEVFNYPHVLPLWRSYLSQFVARYGNTALMRTRQLFATALDGVPRPYAKELYLEAIAFEVKHGTPKRAFALYAKAVNAVPREEALDVYTRWIKTAAAVHGVSATRPIYEAAIAALGDSGARTMTIKYAQLELALGDIVRARALYAHASQFCPPDRDKAFWREWESFESQHGNEDSFREMLRIKRSVQAQYHSVISEDVIAAVAAAQSSSSTAAAPGAGGAGSDPAGSAAVNPLKRPREEDPAAAPGAAAPPVKRAMLAPGVPTGIQFVSSSSSIAGNIESDTAAANPEAIAMDDSSSDDDSDDDSPPAALPAAAPVPAAVFGGLGSLGGQPQS